MITNVNITLNWNIDFLKFHYKSIKFNIIFYNFSSFIKFNSVIGPIKFGLQSSSSKGILSLQTFEINSKVLFGFDNKKQANLKGILKIQNTKGFYAIA